MNTPYTPPKSNYMNTVLKSETNHATIPARPAAQEDTHVLVERRELEHEHMLLIKRLHQLRKILGYSPIVTGKQQRIAQAR